MDEETNLEEVETIEETEEETQETEETKSEETQEEEEKEIEPWMVEEDDQTSQDYQVPGKTHTAMKKKYKGRISKRDDEITKLKAEIDNLKQIRTETPANKTLKRPDEYDFEDRSDYLKALDEYEDARYKERQKSIAAKNQQEEFQRKIQRETENHYQRVDKLVEESGIDVEKYQHADQKVRETLDKVVAGSGDLLADIYISKLGEGSEKVMYYLGNNTAARDRFRNLLEDDPSGLSAMVFLGEQKNRLSGTTKKTISKAKKPAPNVKGDTTANVKAKGRGQKDYDKAMKEGNMQVAFNIKMDAKKAGTDVSKW